MFLSVSVAERQQIRNEMKKHRLEAKHIMPMFRKMCEKNQRVYGSSKALYGLCEITREMRVVELIAFIQNLMDKKTKMTSQTIT